MKLQDLQKINARSIRSAGPRYTPGQYSNFPNLPISDLDDAFIGIIGGKPFQKRVLELQAEVSEQFSKTQKILATVFPQGLDEPIGCLKGLEALASSSPGKGRSAISKIEQAIYCLLRTCKKFEKELEEAHTVRQQEIENRRAGKEQWENTYREKDSELRRIEERLRSLKDYTDTLDNVEYFLCSQCCVAKYHKCILMVGEWGFGKTHYLCDVVRKQVEAKQPALLVLAKDFEPLPNACDAFVSYVNISRRIETLIKQLARLSKKGMRALLIVDGINESDPKAWAEGVTKLQKLIQKQDNVVLIISCRSPMHKSIISKQVKKRMLKLKHPGFSGIAFDAQQSFFAFYDIPLPEVPLLADEFSRPLTLKILCEVFQSLPKRSQRKGFAGLSSGQRGMTYILERFIRIRGKAIEDSFGLPPRTCWKLMKGDDQIRDELRSGLAPYMASTGKSYIEKSDVIQMIQARPKLQEIKVAHTFYRRILAEGLLIETGDWRSSNKNKTIPFVSMPYERFGDHIIARYLLSKYLNTSSKDTIYRSLCENTPLGALFELHDEHHFQYGLEGWGEAIIIEFPERVKNTLPKESTELFFCLPKAQQSLEAYWELFCSGLFWRHPASFSKQTDKIIDALLSSNNPIQSHQIIDALLAIATKSSHTFDGARLYQKLKNMDMPSRDLLWSEYLRNRDNSSSANRLINWFERPISANMEIPTARNLITVLSLFLTTTDRYLRDRVTKILVRFGELYPDVLLERTLESLTFNDPYLPERMLAASYGMAMSLWTDRSNQTFRREIVPFAKQLIRRIYLPTGDFQTPHTLIREYSLGIIDIAQLIKPGCIATQWIAKTRPPFDSQSNPFQNAQSGDLYTEEGKFAIHYNFSNYTIGRLIPKRRNHDFDNPEYVAVREKINWRIYDLGYRQSRFEQVDQAIASDSWRFELEENKKVERYGKKYSWIAYFEMYGIRQATGLLPESRQNERTSDCDIDPSFPKQPPDWTPPEHHFFRRVPASDIDWIKSGPSPKLNAWLHVEKIKDESGPWVLLDGFIRDEHESRLLATFAFLRGFLVDSKDVVAITAAVRSVDYPSSGLPFPGEGLYTFSGEIPWSKRFARSRRSSKMYYEPEDPWKEASRFPMYQTSWHYSWESYHSAINKFSGFYYPAPIICDRLNLTSRNREIDLVDSEGNKATQYKQSRGGWQKSHNALYLRQDLLDDLLRIEDKVLLWVIWGEREFADKHALSENPHPDIVAALQSCEQLFKRVCIYKPAQ